MRNNGKILKGTEKSRQSKNIALAKHAVKMRKRYNAEKYDRRNGCKRKSSMPCSDHKTWKHFDFLFFVRHCLDAKTKQFVKRRKKKWIEHIETARVKLNLCRDHSTKWNNLSYFQETKRISKTRQINSAPNLFVSFVFFRVKCACVCQRLLVIIKCSPERK